jgi:hypothetical protein
MGAWDDGPFGNDSALDWLAEAADDPGALESAFEATLDADYLEVDEGSAAVAAAAIVAAAFDGDLSGLPRDARAVVSNISMSAELRARAVKALERVLGPESELASLWGEGGGESGFHKHIEQLRTRLKHRAQS